ncbi:MAG: immunoglobulin domain-containing protein, partial [Verrucomicrobiota bacterium]
SASNYTGTITDTLVIGVAAQAITFVQPSDRLIAAGSFTLAATSSSGLPVAFTVVSGSPDIATLAGDILTPTGATGTVTIRAAQAGNANYLAAAPIERSFRFVADATPPVIIVPPVDTVGYLGSSVTLTAIVGGAPTPTVQWRRNGTDIPGATTTSLLLASLTLADAGLYQIVATNLAGSVASSGSALTITKRPQTIAFDVAASPYPAGTALTLTATASSFLPVTFTIVSGAASLNGSSLIGQNGPVVIRATQAGDATYEAAEPVERTLTFVTGGLSPFIAVPPTDQTVSVGANVTFAANALGSPTPTFQWQKEGVNISGATNAALVLPGVTLADTGRYTLIATNPSGVARASAQLTVRSAPQIVTQPESRSVALGSSASFQVVVIGFPAPTYQWRRNGTGIANATRATLDFPRVNAGDAGRYDVVVTNSLGAVTSNVATLNVEANSFAGNYFGRFSGANGTGDFALHVRANGTAAFFGHLPGLQTGLATLSLPISGTGEFSLTVTTLAAAPELEAAGTTPPVAAAPRPVTLSGRLDAAGGNVVGTITELGVTLDGTISPTSGSTSTQAGLYQAAVVGSATGRGYAIVGADGRAFVFTSDGATLDSVRGTVGADGRLTANSVGGAAVSLAFGTTGTFTGTARVGTGPVITLAGATEALTGTEHLVNLSIRGNTTAASPLITGFVITGTTAKQVLVRVAGPALAGAPFNVPNALGNPTLQVFRGNTSTAQNDNWGTPAANVATINAASTQAGAFPFTAGSNDAALVSTLQPGAYTVVVGGGNGTVLAEVYEVLQANEAPGTRRLVNLSARGTVTAAAPLIAGFVIGGTAPQRVLIRGIGPSLAGAPFNVAGTLPNPQLTLFRGATAIRTNDDWFRDTAAAPVLRDAFTRAGAFALGAQSLDAALLVYLEPGAYTVQVTGPTNAQGGAANGIALVEIYESIP